MIPRPIYEALPAIYAGAGVFTLLDLDPMVGKISGVLLILASLIIYSLRNQYRKVSKS